MRAAYTTTRGTASLLSAPGADLTRRRGAYIGFVPEIPFELANDHVFVRASVKDVPADLILDTGSSVSTLSEELAARAGATPFPGLASAAGAARMPVRLATVRSVSLSGVELGETIVGLLQLDAVSRAAGRRVDGTLGYDLFVRHAVEIDYARQVLAVRDSGSIAAEGRVSLAVETRARIPLVDAMLEVREGVRVPARLVVDLGSSALALRLSASFVERHSAAFAAVQGVGAPIGAGVGGRLMGEVVRLRSLQIGSLTVPTPVAGLAREKKGALEAGLFDGTVGAPVLRPWFAADYQRGRVYLHPDAGKDGRYDASGLTLTTLDGRIAVEFVVRRSAAAEAGLEPGDVIEKMDGRELSARDVDRVRRAFREAASTRLLHVARVGSVPLRLRTLV